MIKQYNVTQEKKDRLKDSKILSDEELKYLLQKRAEELNIKVSKCGICKNPCTRCKVNFLKKELTIQESKKENISSLHYHKNKRKIEKFWLGK